jgi:hypothetical protein
MEMQTNASRFAASYLYEQPVLVPPDLGPGAHEYIELKEYVAQALLRDASVDDLRDRLSALLRDERYHELTSRLREVTAFKAFQETIERGFQRGGDGAFAEEIRPLYIRAMRLQAHVLLAWVAYTEMNAGGTSPKLRTSRLGFMQEAIPVEVKRAFLAFWIAPMCRVALGAAADTHAPGDVHAFLLNEWISNMERQLALYIALGVSPPAGEHAYLLPQDRLISLRDSVTRFDDGHKRTLAEMAEAERRFSNDSAK